MLPLLVLVVRSIIDEIDLIPLPHVLIEADLLHLITQEVLHLIDHPFTRDLKVGAIALRVPVLAGAVTLDLDLHVVMVAGAVLIALIATRLRNRIAHPTRQPLLLDHLALNLILKSYRAREKMKILVLVRATRLQKISAQYLSLSWSCGLMSVI